MQEVEVKALPLELLASILTPERGPTRWRESAARARAAFGDRTIWHVNATAHGGGVAEMLQTLLAYGRGAQIENRWLVLDGEPEFFAITKRLHNLLHGDPGDGGPLGDARARLLRTGRRRQRRRDARPDRRPRHRVAPRPPDRRHGRRPPGDRRPGRVALSRRARHAQRPRPTRRGPSCGPTSNGADAFVFSREEYVPDWVDRERLVIIPPSIDPFSAKNRELDPPTVSAILATVGVGHRRRSGRAGPLRTPRRLPGHRPAPHRPHRRRSAAAPRRAARRPGQPVGPAQGHGRRARRASSRWPPTVPTTPTSCSSGRTCPA